MKMKTNGQIAYEAYCASIQWLQPKMESWPRLGTAAKDAWETAADAIVFKVKEELKED